MARSLSIAAYLANLGVSDRHRETEDYPPRPEGNIIWARCSDLDQLTMVESLGRKLSEDGDPVQIIATLHGWHKSRSNRALPEPKGKESIRNFIKHWRPVMAIWVRGDFDLVMLDEIRSAKIPSILVDANGEGLDTVVAGWVPGALRSVLAEFEALLTLDMNAAERLIAAGAPAEKVLVSGAMEDSDPALPCNDAERQELAEAVGTRPVWLAAAAQLNDWPDLCIAHQDASRQAHRLLLIVVPAKSRDAPEFAEKMRGQGFHVTLRSEDETPGEPTQVYVVDTDEELGLWYRIAPITYLGGTLNGGGCRDPFEATALGSAVLYGPLVAPYGKHAARLNTAGASRLIRSSDDMGNVIEALLSPDKTAEIAHAAWDVTSRGADVTNRVAAYINDRLEEMGH